MHVVLVLQDDDATSVLSGSGDAVDEQDEDGTYCVPTLHCMLQLVLHLVCACMCMCVCACVPVCICVRACVCTSACPVVILSSEEDD